MSESARIIKFADREHNVSDLINASSTFRLKYAQETEYILNHIDILPSQEEKQIVTSIWNYINPILTNV